MHPGALRAISRRASSRGDSVGNHGLGLVADRYVDTKRDGIPVRPLCQLIELVSVLVGGKYPGASSDDHFGNGRANAACGPRDQGHFLEGRDGMHRKHCN